MFVKPGRFCRTFDRDNCALKLTQRRKNKGKVTIKFYSYIKNKNMHLGKRGVGGRGGIDQWVKRLNEISLSVQ